LQTEARCETGKVEMVGLSGVTATHLLFEGGFLFKKRNIRLRDKIVPPSAKLQNQEKRHGFD